MFWIFWAMLLEITLRWPQSYALINHSAGMSSTKLAFSTSVIVWWTWNKRSHSVASRVPGRIATENRAPHTLITTRTAFANNRIRNNFGPSIYCCMGISRPDRCRNTKLSVRHAMVVLQCCTLKLQFIPGNFCTKNQAWIFDFEAKRKYMIRSQRM